MTSVTRPLDPGTPVDHPRHGSGRVVADMGATVVVRFGGALEQVPRRRDYRHPIAAFGATRGGPRRPGRCGRAGAGAGHRIGQRSMGRLLALARAVAAASVVGLPDGEPRMAVPVAGGGRRRPRQDHRVRPGTDAADCVRPGAPASDPRAGEAGAAVAVSPEGHVRHPSAALRRRSGHAARGFLGRRRRSWPLFTRCAATGAARASGCSTPIRGIW